MTQKAALSGLVIVVLGVASYKIAYSRVRAAHEAKFKHGAPAFDRGKECSCTKK